MSPKPRNAQKQVLKPSPNFQLKATHIAYGAIVLSILLTVSMVITKKVHERQSLSENSITDKEVVGIPNLSTLKVGEATPRKAVSTNERDLQESRLRLNSHIQWEEMDFSWEAGMASLNWSTNEQRNSRFFEIERSFDGSRYSSLGKFSPEYLHTDQGYAFHDKALELVEMPRVYYRVRHVGLDGKEMLSKPITVDIPAKVGLYAKLMEKERGQIMLQCAADKRLLMEVKVHNDLGEEILKKSIKAEPDARLVTLHSTKLVAGAYHLTLTDNDRITVTESFQISE